MWVILLSHNPNKRITYFCLVHTQQSVAEGTRLYRGKTMRGSVASQAGAVDRLIPYKDLAFRSINFDFVVNPPVNIICGLVVG